MNSFLVCTHCGARNTDPGPSFRAEDFLCGACGQQRLVRVAPQPADRTGQVLAGAAVGGAAGAVFFGPAGALVGGLLGMLVGGVRK